MRGCREFIVASVLLAAAVPTAAQTAKPKPTVKVTASQTGGQMPGASAKIGTPYKLGKKGDELHFTLEKAEFATRFMSDSDTYVAKKDNRLLLVYFAVQNPQKFDMQFHESSFKFTVVSPDDENFTGNNSTGGKPHHPDRRNALNMSLKPVQKVRAVVAIHIHPQGPVNKLIVERGSGNPVLRFDLKQLVKALEGPFATEKGLGSINPGIGVLKVPIPLGPFDYTIDSIEEGPSIPDYDPGDGQKVVVARISLNDVSLVQWWASAIMSMKLFDVDGEEARFIGFLKNSSSENFHLNPAPGQVYKYRAVYYVPAAAKLQRLELYDSWSGRTVVVPLLPIP